MSEPPAISVVVPIFNGERFLAEALDSILAQSYPSFEVIAADDGSTDGSRAVVEGYGGRVRWVSQPTAGPAATRNLGVREAHGDFLAFLDPDDLWHREKLERQVAHFAARPELQLCVTHVQVFWADPEEAARYRDHPRAQPIPGYATTSLLARRSAFERIGDFNTGLWFSDATEWFMRATEAGLPLELLRDVLVYHRMHQANLTRRRDDASRDEFLQVVKASLERRRAAGGRAG